MKLLYGAIVWLVGIAVGALGLGLRPELAGPVAGLAGGAGAAMVLAWPHRGLRWLAAGCALGLLGLARVLFALPPATPVPGSLASYNAPAGAAVPTVLVRGIVREEPRPNSAHTGLVLGVEVGELWRDGAWQAAPGGLWVLTGRISLAHQGDRVQVSGALQDAPTFPDFDYRAYLLRQGYGSYMRYGRLQVLEPAADGSLLTRLATERRQLGQRLARWLPEPQAGLAQGIVLGQGHALAPDLREAFSLTGTAHIIAVSGTNITLLLAAIFFLTRRFLSLRAAIALALAAIGLYSLFVGLEPPVVRAAIMGAAYLIGQGTGRAAHAPTLLAAAAAAMTVWNPLWVLDIGFQLSFAAMIGLITLAPRLLPRLQRVPGGVRELLAATLAAQLFTDPLLAYHFGAIPLVGPLANLLAEPLMVPVMALGSVAVVGGGIWEPLGQALAFLCWVPLTLMILVVQGAAGLPLASVPWPDVGVAGVVLWYGVLLAGLWATSLSGAAVETAPVPRWRALGLSLRRQYWPGVKRET